MDAWQSPGECVSQDYGGNGSGQVVEDCAERGSVVRLAAPVPFGFGFLGQKLPEVYDAPLAISADGHGVFAAVDRDTRTLVILAPAR